METEKKFILLGLQLANSPSRSWDFAASIITGASHAFLGSIPDLHVPPLGMLFLLFLAREASFRFDPFSIDLEKKSPLGASALSRGRLQASTTGQRAEKAPTGRRSLPSFYFTTDNAHSPK